MDSRSWGMLARFAKKRRDYPVYPHIILPTGHDEREIAVTLLRNVGHAFREITGHDGAKYADTSEQCKELALQWERDLKVMNLDTVRAFMVALNVEGRITMINRAGCELLGYTQSELLWRNWFEICLPQPAGIDVVFPAFQQIIAGDLPSTEYYENAVLCRDGTQRLIAWHNTYTTDSAGHIVGTISSGDDITERRQAEEALRTSEARFRLLSSATFEGIAITEHGRFIDANDQLLNMLGYTRDDLIGLPVEALLPPEDRERVLDNIRSNRLSHIEHVMICKDGSHVRVEAQGQTIDRTENTVRITALRDITERNRLDEELRASKAEAERANAAKSRFLAAASHDLRQPLSALSIYVGV